MGFAFIERHRTVWPIIAQCRVLGVRVSGYSQFRARQKQPAGEEPSPSKPGSVRLSDMALLVHIRAIFLEMKGAKWSEPLARSSARDACESSSRRD